MRAENIQDAAPAWRPPLLWLLAFLCLLATISTTADLIGVRRANRAIADLLDQHDVAVDPRHAFPQEVLARANESIRRDHIDEAQTILSITEAKIPERTRAEILYNIANARTRAAAEHVRVGDIDGAAALINLAKSEYRMALKIAPDDWNIRYNIDVAMRVVRDLPEGANLPDREDPFAPKKLWTDLPGVPKGLP